MGIEKALTLPVLTTIASGCTVVVSLPSLPGTSKLWIDHPCKEPESLGIATVSVNECDVVFGYFVLRAADTKVPTCSLAKIEPYQCGWPGSSRNLPSLQ